MKIRSKRLLGLLLCGVAVTTLLVFVGSLLDRRMRTALEETRRVLREQGFKIDLTDFDFSTSSESRSRESALTLFSPKAQPQLAPDPIESMTVVHDNSVMVLWKQDWVLTIDEKIHPWSDLERQLDAIEPQLDAACEAALSGPIRFDLRANDGSHMLVPHLPAIRSLASALNTRMARELHNGNTNAAWTNLLASTRLLTAWDTEPAEISQLIRFNLMSVALSGTWQALQSDQWSDDQLARLQREWESVDFFKSVPDTAAFERACAVDNCQLERKDPESFGPSASQRLKDAIRAPHSAWYQARSFWERLRYLQSGSYDDEKAVLLFYQQREVLLRRAVQSTTWAAMRELPGVTNYVPFHSRHSSMAQCLLNLREMMYVTERSGYGIAGRAAEAEARRRLIITATALERYRRHHQIFPESLQQLTPEFLKTPLVDFMDGKPLRYHRTDDGHFVLYSVGLDCTDHGGRMPPHDPRDRYEVFTEPFFTLRFSSDLVWPRPASADATETMHEERLKAWPNEIGKAAD